MIGRTVTPTYPIGPTTRICCRACSAKTTLNASVVDDQGRALCPMCSTLVDARDVLNPTN